MVNFVHLACTHASFALLSGGLLQCRSDAEVNLCRCGGKLCRLPAVLAIGKQNV